MNRQPLKHNTVEEGKKIKHKQRFGPNQIFLTSQKSITSFPDNLFQVCKAPIFEALLDVEVIGSSVDDLDKEIKIFK